MAEQEFGRRVVIVDVEIPFESVLWLVAKVAFATIIVSKPLALVGVFLRG